MLYPNPTQTELLINIPLNEGSVQIQVFDMASVQVLNLQENLQNGSVHLPVSTLTPGIYSIRIQYNQKIEYSKFIKL
ncbi:MAG: T9SS type A sorting domain-containing protein [Bacteroidetes bacterium]|nr:T9SS type A sorting domain-containing protein [Bacteroidota bacterium]